MAEGNSSDSSLATEPLIRFEAVSKRFDNFFAVERLSLDIFEREFFALLGPSGCGKTTLLRMLAGFEQPSEGRILLDGENISEVPPHRRPVNMMFQSYALFPHLTVEGNIAFGLKQDGMRKPQIAERVREMLALVKLEGFGGRKPHQLSGGQRQRVALARALVNEPRVLLLDEPLGALDLKLRQQMQIELKAIQKRVGLTFIYVTHDPEEALTMSDRLAVMNDGHIEQVGTPATVYEQPATAFVAGFVGVSNILEGEAARAVTGTEGAFTVRPEKLRMVDRDASVGANECTATGTVREVIYVGSYTRYVVALDGGGELVVTEQNTNVSSMDALQVRGRAVRLVWERQHNRPVEMAGPEASG
jgi:putative spermidine/putrescine transport system ATP-binding protein